MSNLLAFPRQTLDGRTFAEATSRLAGAVAIVTWQVDKPGGLLVRSVSLLSTRPARILFGVDKEHPGHDLLLGADTCAINLLSEADEDEAARFEDQHPVQTEFPQDSWRVQPDRPPRFIASAIHLEGIVDHRINAGSHSLFAVCVDAAEVNDRAPLVSFDHGFRRLAQAAPSIGPASQTEAASA
jgi:flavin reductase (DIM6/NTAB) family NADH-FMN oxidoreductase RutF